MRWAPQYSREAVDALYHRVEREHVKAVTDAIKMLLEDPEATPVQPSEEDPSVYWIAVPGDYVVYFEIIDEKHVVRIIDIA
jgi:mRNA-degrading endonuclease RelE of RelBE toxin-antitoxin system